MSRAAHSTASSAEPELEQVEDGESDEDGRRDVPGSWAGYGWHLVKTAGYGAYSGKYIRMVPQPFSALVYVCALGI